jgi:integrase
VPRQRSSVPTYRLHKQSGQAVSDFYDPVTGQKRMVSLGRYNSPESKQEHARIVAEVAAGRPAGPTAGLSVNELVLAFLRHADGHYRRPDGTSTDELNNVKQTARVVRELYGHTAAAGFGPLALKAVRQRMIEKGWSRKNINLHVGRVRRVFKFGVENELIPANVLEALKAVPGLQRGRTTAKETAPILPVADGVVDATLPHVSRHVAGLIRFQRLTGCRPGEAVRLRRCDIDTSAAVWVYRPAQHKTAHRGKVRLIHIGPQAQAVLDEFPTADEEEFVFSPRRELAERNAARAAGRKTKFYASRQGWQQRKAKPKRAAGEKYTSTSYGHAVRKAVRKANERRAGLANGGQFDAVPPWHPNQIRHSFATTVRREHGLDVAQALLGHDRVSTTEIYAEKSNDKAAAVASAIG